MSASLFEVTEHTIPCQHIREYPHAVKSAQNALKLAIKEYRPLNNLNASPDSITIIAAHANGVPKFADSSHQGASGVLNKNLQGDDPSWFDHSRDLLSMVNHFRNSIVQPILGIAHSMGCAQLVQLSLIHPRLFHSLILMEPVIQDAPPSGPNAAYLTSYRSDLWPSRSDAEFSFRRIRFFETWDPRVFDRYLQFALRNAPTALYPETVPDAVTLTTTKHQEAWSYVRSNFTSRSTNLHDTVEHLVAPDLDFFNEGLYLFHRAESCIALRALPYVRPTILWIFGAKSFINTPASQDQKMAMAGTSVGGSGGAKAGMVERVVIENAGHMAPLERVQETVDNIARYLKKEIKKFRDEEAFYKNFNSAKSEQDMLVMSKEWLSAVRQKADTRRPIMLSCKSPL